MSDAAAPAARLDFPSPAWCAAFQVAINENEAYRTSAKEWTHGPVAFVVTAEPAIGIAEDLGVWLDMDRGECRGCRMVSRAEAENAAFVIVASYARWKDVIGRKLDPTKGMMQNKLKLHKGHMPTALKFIVSNRELVESTARVPTRFIDE